MERIKVMESERSVNALEGLREVMKYFLKNADFVRAFNNCCRYCRIQDNC